MTKFDIFAVMGRGYIVVNKSNGTHVFSGTLNECNNFINNNNETTNQKRSI
jgi:hypothetical protein